MLRDVRRSGLVHLLGYQRYLRLELCELNLINMNGKKNCHWFGGCTVPPGIIDH